MPQIVTIHSFLYKESEFGNEYSNSLANDVEMTQILHCDVELTSFRHPIVSNLSTRPYKKFLIKKNSVDQTGRISSFY